VKVIKDARVYSFSLVDEPLLPEWRVTLVEDDEPDD
jgi:hypothetical protein